MEPIASVWNDHHQPKWVLRTSGLLIFFLFPTALLADACTAGLRASAASRLSFLESAVWTRSSQASSVRCRELNESVEIRGHLKWHQSRHGRPEQLKARSESVCPPAVPELHRPTPVLLTLLVAPSCSHLGISCQGTFSHPTSFGIDRFLIKARRHESLSGMQRNCAIIVLS